MRKKILILSIVLFLVITLILQIIFLQLFYPGVYISGINVGALSKDSAREKVIQVFNSRVGEKLNFDYQEATSSAKEGVEVDLSDVTLASLDETLEQAFTYGHRKIYKPPVNIKVQLQFGDKFKKQLNTVAQTVNKPAIDSQLKLQGDQITVTPSQEGQVLDETELKRRVEAFINSENIDTRLPVKKSYPGLSYQTALSIKNRLDQIKLIPLRLVFKEQSWILTAQDVISLLDLEKSKPSLAEASFFDKQINITGVTVGSENYTDSQIVIDQNKLQLYLEELAGEIDREVKEPLFNFDGKRVTEFQPPTEGRKLNIKKAGLLLNQNLLSGDAKQLVLPVDTVQPKNKLSNELGIKELLGRGISNFAGSIQNRIYNINLTATRINGILIPPGQTFSFLNTVGDITAANGFKQAYVIKNGRTVLDDGGGVCQDSTTMFRAALNAGLPIVKRTAHAYRVGYYEQGFPPGLDATVFYPTVDFQFKNDTPAHILIQAYTEGLTLYVDLYGTSDGRVVKLTTPITTNQTPPPPELRQDDPTLPRGTVKQVDFSAWGANVVFSRTVTRDGQVIINDTFRSNYRPWQAVYLVGTGS